MKQKTAIFRAIRGKYDAHKIAIKNGLLSASWNDGGKLLIGHMGDFRTVDHGGHSTRVYLRDVLIYTVFGTVGG